MDNLKNTITGTLFPDGVLVNYLTNGLQGRPWPKPSATMLMVNEAIKQGYTVVYINLENDCK